MGKDIRYERPWGKGKKTAKSKRKSVKTGLQARKKYKKNAPQSTEKSRNSFDDYIDPDDGFEKFENH